MNDCIKCDCAIRSDGYGVYNSQYAHRIAWIKHNGPIPNGLQVQHKCDNRWCVNPDHLYLGTQSQNMCDKINRLSPNIKLGRTAYKLSPDDLLEIKKMKAEGCPVDQISSKFNCSNSYIYLLLRGERGKNIKFDQKWKGGNQ